MKKIHLFILIATTIFFASGCTEKYKKEIERLNAYSDSLKNSGVEKDTVSMSYIRAFNSTEFGRNQNERTYDYSNF